MSEVLFCVDVLLEGGRGVWTIFALDEMAQALDYQWTFITCKHKIVWISSELQLQMMGMYL